VKGSLSWKIVRFKELDKHMGEYVESPEFPVGDYKWSLFLYPNGSKEDAKNYISIFLSCLNILQEVTINFTVMFVSKSKGSNTDKVLGPIKKTFGEDELDWGWSKALDHYAMNTLFLSDEDSTLHIKCDVEVFGDWVTTIDNQQYEEKTPKIHIPECTLPDDFEKLLFDHPQSDVVIIVGNEQFPCHKGLLSVRSSVFRGMFANDMREGREGVVHVEDVDPDIFRECLRYIYSGKCSPHILEDYTLEILTVADKYDLPRLKRECESLLLSRLSVTTAPSTLCQADMYHAVQLKYLVLDFIVSHFYEVIAMEDFKDWSIENPQLVAEIHEALSVKNGTKQDLSMQSKGRKNVINKRKRGCT